MSEIKNIMLTINNNNTTMSSHSGHDSQNHQRHLPVSISSTASSLDLSHTSSFSNSPINNQEFYFSGLKESQSLQRPMGFASLNRPVCDVFNNNYSPPIITYVESQGHLFTFNLEPNSRRSIPAMSQENLNQQQQQQQQSSHQQTVVHHIHQAAVNNSPVSQSTIQQIASVQQQIIPKLNDSQQQDRVPSPSDSTNKNGIKILASPPQSVNIVANTNTNLMSSSMIGVRGGREGTGDSNDHEEDTDEDETNEVVEESSDGRWSKRNEPVSRGDVPGIDQAYLAMDTEYGCEVVWNEIKLSNGKRFKNENLHNDEKEIDRVFKNLINLNHPNIVKFHDYWIDKRENDPRIIFITEYLSSGSLKQFLRKAKRTNQSIKRSTWKRWCIQLLTALDYLHNSTPAVLHSDLSCDTIFIQHNGLIKIGSIAPDIVNSNVRTCDMSRMARHLHFIAPEICQTISVAADDTSIASTAADIYSFGMVALEMFNLEFGGNGDTHPVTPELIKQSIEALDSNQQDFINICLHVDPTKRPTAKQLLFHPLLFEVPSLRLLTTHQIVKNQNDSKESNTERIFNDSAFVRSAEFVIASINSTNGSFEQRDFKFSQLASFDANKFLEDVKTGNYPLTAYGLDYQLNKKNIPSTINSSQNNNSYTTAVTASATSTNRSSQSNPLLFQQDTSSSTRSTTAISSSTSKSSSSSTSPSQTLIISESSNAMNSNDESDNQANSDLELISAQMQAIVELNNTTNNNNNNSNFIPSRTQSPTTNNIINNNTILNSNGAIISNNNNNTTSSNTTSGNNNNNNVVYGESEYVLAQQQQQQQHLEYAASMAKLETRHAQQIDINVFLDDKQIYRLTLNITFEDRSARFIQSPLSKNDTVNNLADELVSCGLVNQLDRENLCIRLGQALKKIDLLETTTESVFTHQNTIL